MTEYFESVRQLGNDVMAVARDSLGRSISESRLPLLLVGSLAGPATRRTPKVLRLHREVLLLNGEKLPGMGYILASEFFRNLHFSAFKPDRHIQRLIDRWCPEVLCRVRAEVIDLQGVIGTRGRDLATYLTYSLIGIEASPPGVPVTHTDNVVWLLGAYVERRGGKRLPYTCGATDLVVSGGQDYLLV